MIETIEPMPAAIDQHQLARDVVDEARFEGIELIGPGTYLLGGSRLSCPLPRTMRPVAEKIRKCSRLGFPAAGAAGEASICGHASSSRASATISHRTALWLLIVITYAHRVTATLRTEAIPRQIQGRAFGHWTHRYKPIVYLCGRQPRGTCGGLSVRY